MSHWLGVTAAARSCGVSVRTLQHYDRIGVLPAVRDDAGRRVYGPHQLVRLQEIRLLTGSGLSLTQAAVALEGRPARELTEILAEQAGRLETAELVLRGRRLVVAALADVLRRHPSAQVPAIAVAALTDADRTLSRYPVAGDGGLTLTDDQVQRVLHTYFVWKARAVQAAVLLANDIDPDTASGRRLGADQAAMVAALSAEAPELIEVHRRGAAASQRWPAADRALHQRTEDYLARCEAAHLARPS